MTLQTRAPHEALSAWLQNPDVARVVTSVKKKVILNSWRTPGRNIRYKDLTELAEIIANSANTEVIPVAFYITSEEDYEDLGDHLFREGVLPENYVGLTLKRHKEKYGLTNTSLEERAKVAKADITRYEKGTMIPGTATMLKLFPAVGLHPDFLVPVEKLMTPAYVGRTLEAAQHILDATRTGGSQPYDPTSIQLAEAYAQRVVEAQALLKAGTES